MLHFKSDYLVSVAVTGLGIFFMIQANAIEFYQDEALIGPRLVPMVIAGLIIGLGILEFAVTWMARNDKDDNGVPGNASESKLFTLSQPAISRMAAIIMLGFAYIWLFGATGYLISTTLVLGALLAVFGNRSVGKLAVLTLVGAAVYYAVFIKLMGIHDPPGWLIDISSLG